MTTGRLPYEYAILRVVPRIDRGECLNAGILLYAHRAGYLDSRIHLDGARLAALDPTADAGAIAAALHAAADCRPAPGDDAGRRFRWLTAPRSTVVQPGPVHTGLTADPAADLHRLFALLVLPITAAADTR